MHIIQGAMEWERKRDLNNEGQYIARSIQCAILHTARCVACVSTTPVIIRWYKWHKQKAHSYQKRHTHFSSDSETHHTTPHRTYCTHTHSARERKRETCFAKHCVKYTIHSVQQHTEQELT